MSIFFYNINNICNFMHICVKKNTTQWQNLKKMQVISRNRLLDFGE
jgi:hypothetical protein